MGVIYNRNRKKGLFYIPSGGLGPSVSADFAYGKSSYNQGEADPTPTITGTAGGSFNADAGVVFVDTGSFNSSTGQIDLSATTIDSHIITYTVDGVQSGQTVGVTAIPYQSTSSFTFDGINDYFVGPKIGFGTNDFSISLWVNYSYGAGNARFNTLIDFRETAYNVNGLSFSLFENKASVYIGGVGTVGTSTITLSQNLWTNIILTKTSGEYKVYFNDSNSSRSEVLGTNTTSLDEKTANIGIEWDESFGPFNGLMDELSIWNTALSSDAVTEIYNSGAPNDLTSLSNASNTNLKAWYKF